MKNDLSLKKQYVHWAYRLFLDREPENENVLEERVFGDSKDLRDQFMDSPEFCLNNPQRVVMSDLWVLHESKLGFKIYVNLLSD